jgi:hypothetical protein
MARNVKGGSTGPGGDVPGNAGDVIKTLASTEGDASRLLEIYYWTREPGIVALIHAYLDMPERVQRQFGGFLRKTRPQSIAASIDEQGRLVLSRADGKPQVRPAKRNGGS